MGQHDEAADFATIVRRKSSVSFVGLGWDAYLGLREIGSVSMFDMVQSRMFCTLHCSSPGWELD